MSTEKNEARDHGVGAALTDDPYALTVVNLRRRSQAVYLACEEPIAADISKSLLWAADEIDRLRALSVEQRAEGASCPECEANGLCARHAYLRNHARTEPQSMKQKAGVCCYCDATLCCSACGVEQPDDTRAEPQTALIQKIEAEARRYAEMYSPSSDGRNTFVIFADWIDALARSQAESAPHVSWSDADYLMARDLMIEILRQKCWTISEKQGVQEFDNAFQHAVGILSLNAQTSRPRRRSCGCGWIAGTNPRKTDEQKDV